MFLDVSFYPNKNFVFISFHIYASSFNSFHSKIIIKNCSRLSIFRNRLYFTADKHYGKNLELYGNNVYNIMHVTYINILTFFFFSEFYNAPLTNKETFCYHFYTQELSTKSLKFKASVNSLKFSEFSTQKNFPKKDSTSKFLHIF